jgi:3-oxoadipate enol-lactonase
LIETMHTTARRLDLAYRAKGQGPTLVLLHAFPLNQDMWSDQIEALAEASYVITLDLPGFGSSQTTDGDYSLDTMAEIVHEFLRHLGHERVVLGGMSMGGYIALAYARKYPAHLQGLILANTKAGPDSPEARAARLKQIAEIESSGLIPLATTFPGRVVTPASKLQRPELVKRLADSIVGNNAVAVAGALQAMADRPNSLDVLPGVHVPTLVIVGEADALTPPSESELMMEHLPNGTLVRIPAAGHLSNMEQPEAFNRAIASFMHQFTR